MHCPKCQHDNREGAKFCEACGNKLDLTCASCGAIVRPTARFCDNCGSALASQSPSAVPSSTFPVQGSRPLAPSTQPLTPNPQPPSSYTPAHLAERIRATVVTDGERKTITALFADLKGSTALIEGLDPEEARALIDPALQLMMDAVHQYDGYVAQALGDGIFALFGAPIAHEDHPQRALYAALRMQEEMRRYADQVRLQYGAPLSMRVGVNTGEVVVRSIRKDDLHTDYVPVGHATNLAARMEQMATPGSILITEYTHKLIAGYFEVKALGAATLKGVEDPLNVYEVLGAGPLRTRLQVSAQRGLTRFVGRQREMEQLQRALTQAKAGQGQIAGVMGEPGLGKSRLFYEFNLLAQSGCLVLEAYSVSHGKASPYLPVIELLRSYLQIQPHDDERTRRQKVIGKVLELDRALEDTLPYLYALLGVEEQPSPFQQMDPQIRRKRTFEALKRLFLRESLKQPVMLIFEDLHWIDSETQGLLDVLSESLASARVLLLVNYRPEYRHEWSSKTYYTQLRLAPLSSEEAEEILDALLGVSVGADRRIGPSELGVHQGTSLQDLKRLILTKTEGTPFFMEEIVQDLFEQGVLVQTEVGAVRRDRPPEGVHTGAPLQIPPTVQGVLAARIDRLAPEEKALLQQLAVIGREFPLSLLKQVIAQPEDELYRLLSSLQRKEFLYEQPAFPEVEYIFKHALTQEVAYGSLLLERRKVWHEQTGRAIEQLYHERLEEHYSELAYHYQRSDNAEKAVEYLQKAGQQAEQRSAHVEAVTLLTKALELLKTLPDTEERTKRELALLIALGSSLRASKGFAASEVETAYTRAQQLCERMGEIPQRFSVLRGLYGIYLARGQSQLAQELAVQLLQLAEHVQDSAFLSVAHHVMAMVAFQLGELTSARTHLEQGIAQYDPQRQRSLSFLSPLDPGVDCRSWMSEILWYLGYPDQALRQSQEALALAYELPHRFTLAAAFSHAATLHRLRREPQLTQQHTEALGTLATEQEFSFHLAWNTALQGWAMVEQGKAEEGVAHIRQGIAALDALGELSTLFYAPLLIEAYGKAGQPEEGLNVLAKAVDLMHETGVRRWEAELYRLKGELTLQSQVESHKSKVEEAQACFLKAIEIAQKQQAKSFELRATVSLARLWQSQGKRHAAHNILADIYNWFTEGFDTVDLKEAQALLDELL